MMSTKSKSLERRGLLSELRGVLPGELYDFLEQCVCLLPEELKFRLRKGIAHLPSQGDNLERVLEFVRKQWVGLKSEDWVQIALVGPAHTGKSTLIQEIQGGQVESARSIFTVVDTQGLEEFLGYQQTHAVPEEVKGADIVLLVLDARYEFTQDTVRMVESFSTLGKTFLVVLNKIDLIENPRQTLRKAKQLLGVDVLSVSAFSRKSIGRLLRAIVVADSRALYPFSYNFPRFRKRICESIVGQSALGAALVGAVPIPVSDVLPITALQIAMLLKIARVFGFTISRERARELLPVLTAGILLREGGHRLRERFPRQKALIAVSVGGLWTYVVGRASVEYFDRLSQVLQQTSAEGRYPAESV